MKQRTGFVSNSSSSSFIVSAKKGVIPTVTVEIELPIDTTIKTVKELNKYFLEQYGCGEKTIKEFLENPDNDYYKETYESCLAEIENSKVVYIGTVANDSGNAKEEMLYDCGLDGNINDGTIIQDCCG